MRTKLAIGLTLLFPTLLCPTLLLAKSPAGEVVISKEVSANSDSVECINPKDGSVLITLPEGDLPYGLVNSGDRKSFHLKEYQISKLEVTNGQYSYFIASSGYQCSDDRWNNYAKQRGDSAPVAWVTRDDALAYCKWAGLRLPSWAELEMAAKNLGTTYKWNWAEDYSDFEPSRGFRSARYEDQDIPYSFVYIRPSENLPSICLPWLCSQSDPRVGFRCAKTP